jgi:high-affinity Fe2+/Pb2+ permease
MHRLGAFHAPAVAVSIASVLGESTWQDCLRAYPALLAVVVLVLLMAWGTHRLLGDDTYPDSWW